jgi:hypothetical protein
VNNYEVVSMLRVFGGALRQATFATPGSYWGDRVVLQAADTNWDSVSAWTGLLPAGNLVPGYKIASVTGMKPGVSVASVTFLAEHADTGPLITVNSGSLAGGGFTISLVDSRSDPFSSGSVRQWPGSLPSSND